MIIERTVRSEREKLRMIWVMVAPIIKVGNIGEIYFARMFTSLVLVIFTLRCLWDIQMEMANDQLNFEVSLGMCTWNYKNGGGNYQYGRRHDFPGRLGTVKRETSQGWNLDKHQQLEHSLAFKPILSSGNSYANKICRRKINL